MLGLYWAEPGYGTMHTLISTVRESYMNVRTHGIHGGEDGRTVELWRVAEPDGHSVKGELEKAHSRGRETWARAEWNALCMAWEDVSARRRRSHARAEQRYCVRGSIWAASIEKPGEAPQC